MPPFAALIYSADTDDEIEQARSELREALEKVDKELEERGHEDLHEDLAHWNAYRARLLTRPSAITSRAENLTERTVENRADD